MRTGAARKSAWDSQPSKAGVWQSTEEDFPSLLSPAAANGSANSSGAHVEGSEVQRSQAEFAASTSISDRLDQTSEVSRPFRAALLCMFEISA